jgi:hypothetical protein
MLMGYRAVFTTKAGKGLWPMNYLMPESKAISTLIFQIYYKNNVK